MKLVGVKSENQFPKSWKLDPQNEDVDIVIIIFCKYRFSVFMGFIMPTKMYFMVLEKFGNLALENSWKSFENI